MPCLWGLNLLPGAALWGWPIGTRIAQAFSHRPRPRLPVVRVTALRLAARMQEGTKGALVQMAGDLRRPSAGNGGRRRPAIVRPGPAPRPTGRGFWGPLAGRGRRAAWGTGPGSASPGRQTGPASHRFPDAPESGRGRPMADTAVDAVCKPRENSGAPSRGHPRAALPPDSPAVANNSPGPGDRDWEAARALSGGREHPMSANPRRGRTPPGRSGHPGGTGPRDGRPAAGSGGCGSYQSGPRPARGAPGGPRGWLTASRTPSSRFRGDAARGRCRGCGCGASGTRGRRGRPGTSPQTGQASRRPDAHRPPA